MRLRNSYVWLCAALIFWGLTFWLNSSHQNSAERWTANVSKRIESQLMLLESEKNNLLQDRSKWLTTNRWLYEIDSNKLIRWTTHQFLPEYSLWTDTFSVKIISTTRGFFLVKKWQTTSQRFILGCIPFLQKFNVRNKYLRPVWNEDIFGISKPVLSESFSVGSVSLPMAEDNSIILYATLERNFNLESDNTRAAIVFTLGLFCFLIACFRFLQTLHHRGWYEITFLIALSAWLIIRWVMIKLQLPAVWLDISWFDPQQFASSWFNPSLGDLFLNSLAVFLLCLYVFRYYSQFYVVKRLSGVHENVRIFWGTLLFIVSFYSLLFPYLFLETIFHNSSLSLDITQTLELSPLRMIALMSVLLGAMSAFFFIHIFNRLLIRLFERRLSGYLISLTLAALLFIVYIVVSERGYWVCLCLGVLFFPFLYFSGFSKSLLQASNSSFLYLFTVILIFSVELSFGVRKFVVEERLENQFRFANSYLTDRDQLGEFLLSEARQRILADNFVSARMSNAFLTKDPIRQKISRYYLGSYFDQYDVTISLFSSLGEPLGNRNAVDLSDLLVSLQSYIRPTPYTGVSFFDQIEQSPERRYFTYLPVHRNDVLAGFIALDLKQKKIVPRQVYPELLLDERFSAYLRNKDYSYVYYQAGNVVRSFGDFNYERDFERTWLERPTLYREGMTANGKLHVAVEDDTGAVAIVSGNAYSWFDQLANFAAYFIAGLLLMVLWIFLIFFRSWRTSMRLNYSMRIQLYISLAFMVPLFIVSYTIQQAVSRANDRQLKERFLSEAMVLAEQLSAGMDEAVSASLDQNMELGNLLVNFVRLAGVDASVFYPDGSLRYSSQPTIYDQQLVASVVNPVAHDQITKEGVNSLILDENIGQLNYNAAYVALRSSATGLLTGILSIPFFESSVLYERNQIVVLSNTLIIFVLVFIFFAILSYFAANWLTFPLRMVTSQLGRTSFSGVNKPIEWNSTDEIGKMVQEYNAMISNLEKSKIDLARSQKENAWREMAQQVAHEIKNPLTPMKLTVQQLEYALAKGELSDEKAKQYLQTMLSQLSVLNEVASSFSAFARMPAPILQRLDATLCVRKAVMLYETQPECRIDFSAETDQAWIMADEQVLTRAISNLLLNAIQAGKPGQVVSIQVSLHQEKHEYVIVIRDNGSGIPLELQEKVFLPHFSTKKSGSGLGLAIVRQGVEQSHGTISFESQENVGTVFFLRFAKVN
jgi:signal transduction histidine kinase/low affinity Fe/Cu permease